MSDQTGDITLTLWERQAESFTCEEKETVVLMIINAEVNVYQTSATSYKSILVTPHSELKINPACSETEVLRDWYTYISLAADFEDDDVFV